MVRRSPLVVGVFTPRPVLAGAVVTGLLVLAAGVIAATRPERWFGSLPATMATFTVTSLFGSVVLAVSGAWLGSQARRWGMAEWLRTSERSTTEVFVPPWRLLVVASVVGSLVAAALMLGATFFRSAGLGVDEPRTLLAIPIVLASGVAWAAFGIWVGRGLPRWLAFAAALIAPYGAYFVAAAYAQTPGAWILAVAQPGRDWVHTAPDATTLILHLLFWVCVAGLVTTLAVATQRGRKAWAVGASLTFAAAILSGANFPATPGSEASICRDVGSETQPLRVCTDEGHRAVLSDYAASVADIVGDLPPAVAPRLVVGRDKDLEGQEGIVAPPIRNVTAPSFVIDDMALRMTIGDAVFSRCLLQGPAPQPAVEVGAALALWWRLDSGSDPAHAAYPGAQTFDPAYLPERILTAAQNLHAMDDATRSEWFAENELLLRSCLWSAIELP